MLQSMVSCSYSCAGWAFCRDFDCFMSVAQSVNSIPIYVCCITYRLACHAVLCHSCSCALRKTTHIRSSTDMWLFMPTSNCYRCDVKVLKAKTHNHKTLLRQSSSSWLQNCCKTFSTFSVVCFAKSKPKDSFDHQWTNNMQCYMFDQHLLYLITVLL